MRIVRLAALVPLALLAACGGNPQMASLQTTAPAAAAPGAKALALGVTEPARLKGLNPVQVREVLGSPGFTRRDAPAEIWQYRARACTLDLFLYDDGGVQAVAHYAMRGQVVNERDCFAELTSKTKAVPAS